MRKLCVTFITLGKGTLVWITFKTSLKQAYSHIKHWRVEHNKSQATKNTMNI